MMSVEMDSAALAHVRRQTPEICLEAVRKAGVTLFLVKEQTPEICMAAVKQNGTAINFVKNQTPELCAVAIEQTKEAVDFIRDVGILETINTMGERIEQNGKEQGESFSKSGCKRNCIL